jgi:hypothetical protein
MERPITRLPLATFIEYAATRCVAPSEWQRFAVQHYGDERMEDARRECVRILQRVTREEVPRVDVERLYSIAAALRASEGDGPAGCATMTQWAARKVALLPLARQLTESGSCGLKSSDGGLHGGMHRTLENHTSLQTSKANCPRVSLTLTRLQGRTR